MSVEWFYNTNFGLTLFYVAIKPARNNWAWQESAVSNRYMPKERSGGRDKYIRKETKQIGCGLRTNGIMDDTEFNV